MEEAEKGEIFEWNTKPSSMEEAEKGEVLDRNTKPRLDHHPEATVEAAGLFPDDLIREILSRLPVRSVHRFKCVSVPWRDLIAHPANRKKLPQTLAGFLYMTRSLASQPSGGNSGHHQHHFASVSGDGAAPFDPCFPYLQPNKYKDMAQVDACNGLLLYRGCNEKLSPWNWSNDNFRFVVCNPVTGRWVELPPELQAPKTSFSCIAGLAFDPVASSHFHVLYFEQESYMTAVNIYSSRTGAWSRREYSGILGMTENVTLSFGMRCVFVGCVLYLMGTLGNEHVLLGVDMEGKVAKTISVPYGPRFRFDTIGPSQGCYHYAIASVDDNNNILDSEIELWFLKDCDSKELVLKHTASIDKLMSMTGQKYELVGIHPDCDTIFLVSSRDDTLVSYDMRHQKVGRILNLEKDRREKFLRQKFLPYVPLFSDSLADVHGQ